MFPPHEIHGDPNPNSRIGYPTHTHGLKHVMLPDILIHNACFGPQGNAHIINIIVGSLMFDQNLYNEFMEKSYVERKTGIYEESEDLIICLRKLTPEFLAIKKAYNDDKPSEFGYAQLFVKGDDHTLTDEYYEAIPESDEGPCSNPNCSNFGK